MAQEQVSILLSFLKDDTALLEAQKQLNGFIRTMEVGLTLNLGATAGGWLLSLPSQLKAAEQAGVDYGDTVKTMAIETRTSASTFQVLSMMAAQAGVETTKLTSAVQQMSIHAGEAVNGNKQLADAFGDLHINAQQFSGLPVPQQLEALAKAGASAGWSTQSLNDLSEILGTKTLPQLLPILKLIATDGFKAIADNADKAGLVVNDTVIGALAKVAEQQKITAQSWKVAWADMANATAPAHTNISRLSQMLAQMVGDLAKMRPQLVFTVGGFAEAAHDRNEDAANKVLDGVGTDPSGGEVQKSPDEVAKEAAAAQAIAAADQERSIAHDREDIEDSIAGAKQDAAAAAAAQEKDIEWNREMNEDSIEATRMDALAAAAAQEKAIAHDREDYEDAIAADRMEKEAEEKAARAAEKTKEAKAAATGDLTNDKKHFQSAGAGASAGLADIVGRAGTIGDQINKSMTSIASTMTESIGGALSGLIEGTTRWGQAWRNIGSAIEKSVISNFTNILAQQIVSTAAGVAIHTGGETAKTAATTAGTAARTAVTTGGTLIDILQSGIRLAAHVASETGKTVITLIQVPIRITSIIAESFANIVNAAAGAMSAMASIPYVGPFLAIGAMAAILAAGAGMVKSVSKGFRKGGFTGHGGEDEEAGPVHHEEYVFNAAATSRLGVPFLDALHNGASVYDLAGVHAASMHRLGSYVGNSNTGITGAQAASRQNQTNVAFVDDRQSAVRSLRGQQGRKSIVDVVWNGRGQFVQ